MEQKIPELIKRIEEEKKITIIFAHKVRFIIIPDNNEKLIINNI